MPVTQVLAGLVLLLLVAVAVELAELSARLRVAELRYRDRITEAPKRSAVLDRLSGVALAAVVIWFFALPWVASSGHPASALALFLAMFTVGVVFLGQLRLASVRYPLATFAPLAVVAGAAAMT